MKDFLSIGEVSKLKGVSVKSLRYYADIGILIPAYINPKTGYRYYTMQQMFILDLIIICLNLEIPLKNFNSYVTKDGTLSMDKILVDGRRIANEKIKKLNTTIMELEHMSNHLAISKEIKKNKGEYFRYCKERYFLVAKWDGNLYDIRSFMQVTTKLYKLCEEENIASLGNQGIVYEYLENCVNNLVFVEIEKPKSYMESVLTIPAGNFQCEVFYNENIHDGEDKYLKNKVYKNGSFVIGREIYDSKVESEPTPIEVQVFIP